MKKKVGIITFHRVYNYGAVIQAYALQKILEAYDYDAEVIDFSKDKQLDYTNIISRKNGLKRFLKTLLLFPVISKRMVRKKRFDSFLNQKVIMSKERYAHETELNKIDCKYDVFICGSDQVWNPLKESDFSIAYMLDFTSKMKIAYAPSIGTATAADLKKYTPYLKKFSALSCREKGGASIIHEVTGGEVRVVLDPTLLIDKKELLKLVEEKEDVPYILYYSLDGYENKERNMDILKTLSKKFDLNIKFITPEWPFHRNIGMDVIDAGPIEFLSLIQNAAMVCTNSFHGTALSIKLEKPFYVLEDFQIKDERKRSVLKQLDLQDRVLSNVCEISNISDYTIDYVLVSEKLQKLQKKSKEFLMSALER